MIVIPIQPDTGRWQALLQGRFNTCTYECGSTSLHSNAIFFHGVWLLLQRGRSLKDRRDYRVRF